MTRGTDQEAMQFIQDYEVNIQRPKKMEKSPNYSESEKFPRLLPYWEGWRRNLAWKLDRPGRHHLTILVEKSKHPRLVWTAILLGSRISFPKRNISAPFRC